MKFKELEVSGFKSFAEKTNFYIERGLTGIVGPNGCGKSNVVEALRWCMGETSAKSLRGLGMEDVIFNGTSDLPSKNICEVSIKLENDEDIAQYKNTPEIEIKRKLEKDKGSKYFTTSTGKKCLFYKGNHRVDVLGDPEVTANIYSKSCNLPAKLGTDLR